MKVHNGSIQRKGAKFYLVVRIGGAQKWIPLKTGEVATAQERARQMMPPSPKDTAWLEHLVRLGRAAEGKLFGRASETVPCWENLLDIYLERTGKMCDESGKAASARWLHILKEIAGCHAPAEITSADAHRITSAIAEKYISCRRMIGFFRHCWVALGLDASVWEMNAEMRRHLNERGKSREFYRRFSVDEIRQIYGSLRNESQELADMVAIGYMTGLRLSDVAELDTSEISSDCSTLRIIPNKTRKSKSRPLTIPLVYEAAEAVARRFSALSSDGGTNAPFGVNSMNGGRYLFPPECRHRPSRRLCTAFAACGIARNGCARASFHSLRATFISMMDEADVSPHLTDAITGHGGGGMHARYTQPSASALRSALLKALVPLAE